ncbi:MAG: EhaD family protein [Methanomicrobiaceae archaeon]|nr:EhaD family protein [Methanomicrobiaceae archaeon]
MIEAVLYVFAAIALIGTVSAAFKRDPFDKLIGIGVLAAGVLPFVVVRGYLDVAVAVALIVPVTTIIVLLVCRRDGP